MRLLVLVVWIMSHEWLLYIWAEEWVGRGLEETWVAMLVGTNEFPWCAYQKGWVWLTAWCLPWDNFQFWVLTLVRRHLEGTKLGLLAEYETGLYRKHQASPISVYEDVLAQSYQKPEHRMWTWLLRETESEYLSSCPTDQCRVARNCSMFASYASAALNKRVLVKTWSWTWLEVEASMSSEAQTSPWYTLKRPRTGLQVSKLTRSSPDIPQLNVASSCSHEKCIAQCYQLSPFRRSQITRRWKRHVKFSWLVL